MFVNNINN